MLRKKLRGHLSVGEGFAGWASAGYCANPI